MKIQTKTYRLIFSGAGKVVVLLEVEGGGRGGGVFLDRDGL